MDLNRVQDAILIIWRVYRLASWPVDAVECGIISSAHSDTVIGIGGGTLHLDLVFLVRMSASAFLSRS